jgi:hypothetical protein
MPKRENCWGRAERALNEATLREEVARLRQQLNRALEMLQVMQEELQAAHHALAALRPCPGRGDG